MSLGKGIIASDLNQIGEILTHENTALMGKHGDSEALAEAMIKLIRNPELGHKLGEAARKEAIEKIYMKKTYTQDYLKT